MMWCVIQLVCMMMALGECASVAMGLSADQVAQLEIWGVAEDSSNTVPHPQ